MPGPNTAFGPDAQHRFSMIPRAEIPRSVFDRSSGFKTTFNGGYLVPMFVDEVLPGDTFKCRTTALVRMATPEFPVMDNIHLDFFYFFVPNRLIWSNWERFCGAQDNPGDPTDFEIPIMNEAVAELSLSDYFGMPLSATPYDHSALWHRAYNLIIREWFRSQDLQDSPVVDTDDGPDNPADYVLRRRTKRHDYFSSALPFTQKGDPVLLPLGTSAPLTPASVVVAGAGSPQFTSGSGVNRSLLGTSGSAAIAWSGAMGAPGGNAAWVNPTGLSVDLSGVTVDLTAATAAQINQLREAWQVQRLLERDARGGTRYTEIVRSHFGVTSPDARLQRPEYLGGGSTRINFHPVARTTAPAGGSLAPLAELGAYGVGLKDGIGFNKSFTEHGVLIGLCNVRADLTYQQGLDRMFSRSTRYEFYWPAFAHLGEQAVLNKEIFLQDTAADEEVFGYQERYAEYRYKPSRVTGAFRSTAAAPLDTWHLALDFASLPLLNDVFIEDNPPIARVISVPGEAEFIGDFWHELRCARPMPTYSVPGMVDHF